MIRFVMAFFVVLLGATGQILLKAGAMKLGPIPFTIEGLKHALLKMLVIPYIPVGFFFFVLAALLWLGVLTRVELSYAYPIFSLAFVIVGLASWLFFKEAITIWRVAGILIICLGIAVMYRS